MIVDVKVTGVAECTAAVNAAVARYVAANEAAVFSASDVLVEAAQQLAPFKTGQLRESRFRTRTMPVEIGFAAEYSDVAHERGPQKKFLQRATAEQAPRLEPLVARLTERYAESGTTLRTVAGDDHPEVPQSRRVRPHAPPRRR